MKTLLLRWSTAIVLFALLVLAWIAVIVMALQVSQTILNTLEAIVDLAAI